MKMEVIAEVIETSFKENKTVEFPINGTSMQPLLHKGDFVELAKIDSVNKNDIVLFKRENGGYVLHRIIKIKKDYVIFRGDHQNWKEFPIYKEQLIGKVISIKNKKMKGFKYNLYLFTLKFWIFRKFYGKFM